MKKFRSLAAVLLIVLLLLSGCQKTEPVQKEPESVITSIMTSFYPIYALAINITNNVPDLALSCLVQPQAGCLRSYALSDWDAALLTAQDAVIIGGRGLESFEAALNSLADGPALLTVMSGLTLRDNGKSAVSEEGTHFDGPNPWLFMSVPGAIEMTVSLAYGLAQMDELYADLYIENMNVYIARLEKLAGAMQAEVIAAPGRPIASLHEGLGYFAASLNLNLVAEIAREPGTEQVGNDLEALLSELSESGAEVVLLEREAPQNLIAALNAAGYVTVQLDTLTAHMADGDLEAYERIMLENARLTAKALGKSSRN